MTDDVDTDVSDLPDDEEIIEANLNAAVASAEAAEEAARRLRELYVGLDGIAEKNSRLVNAEEIRRHQTRTQAVLQKLKDEKAAWEERRDALRDKLEELEEMEDG